MNTVFLRHLIQYVVYEVQDADYLVYRTRLVKLLYLIDLEYFRLYGKLVTGFKWQRYKFGPYAHELNTVSRGLGFLMTEEIDSSGAVRISVEEPRNLENLYSGSIKRIADRVINRWGGEDLNALLDYVYCETEPMARAQFGESLNFSLVRRGVRHNVDTTFTPSDKLKEIAQRRNASASFISKDPIYTNIKSVNSIERTDDGEHLPPIQGRLTQRFKSTINFIEGDGEGD